MAKKMPVECTLTTWDECGIFVARMARLQAERDAIAARLEAQIAVLRERVLPRQGEIAEEYSALDAQVTAFAAAHRSDFGEKKSVELSHGTLAFRTNPPSVELLSRKFTWKKVLTAILTLCVGKGAFIRRKIEVDKEAILSAYRSPDPKARITDDALSSIGLRIAQEEEFSIVLKTEAVSTPVSQEPARV